jgi:hypothetical protein
MPTRRPEDHGVHEFTKQIHLERLRVRGLPFFKLLKKQETLQWTEEAQKAFDELKQYLSSPPTLMAPEPNEVL